MRALPDANSIFPFEMWEHFDKSSLKYVKNCEFSKYQAAKNSNFLLIADDDEVPSFVRQHWWVERPVYERVYTGSERGRQWYDKRTGTEKIDYPEAFDDIIWEYAQSERDAAEKDVLAYVTWYNSKREYKSQVSVSLPNPFPSVTWADSSTPPPMTINAEKIGEFKTRLLGTLSGHPAEAILKKYVNEVMNKTRVSARQVGKAKAKTNPLVEETLKTLDIDEILPN